MRKVFDGLLLILGITIVVWSFYAFLQKPAPAKYQTNSSSALTDNQTIKIGEKTFKVEVADTDEERTRGLSGRSHLPDGTGLLFIFENEGMHGFWMYDMRFPIDIAWLDDNLEVIDIEKNVSPDTFPHVFYPPRPVKYVFEVNAGEL